MNVKFLNPFLDAATEVVQIETGYTLTRGELGLEKTVYVTNDVTVIIAIIGMVTGNVFFSLDYQAAKSIAERMMGEPLESFDYLAQSAIAELGNVITGNASIKLSEAGYIANISTPTMLLGKGATISTLDFPRLVVPLSGEFGAIHIHLALRESPRAPNPFLTGEPPQKFPVPNRPL